MENRRIGMGPIPPVPEDYLTEQQLTKLDILKKFGWILVCIRRPENEESTIVLRHKQDHSIGIMKEDGTLTISEETKIRGGKLETDNFYT
ncbi:MAG: hypothetical protein KZQ90_14615 [Candidatus Thiodiazotropha sp. (ex Codakia rugifera)]|nr:hypothetical protein [Candidatus Thiodiazotropha sp. (ex Codakia rugifera)]